MARVPSYRLHKPSGQAVVTLNGHDHYLGKHDSVESRNAYDRLLGLWIAGGRKLPNSESDGPTIDGLMVRYWRYCEVYYRKHGKPTSQLYSIRSALQSLGQLFGREPASTFTPGKLKIVRQSWVDAGLCRDTANRYGSIVKRLFDWAAESELFPGTVAAAIRVVRGLPQGRCTAHDNEPVAPVPLDVLDSTLPRLGPRFATMVRVQLLTGMRPGEVCQVRLADIDQSGPVWMFVPANHKSEHHGKGRSIAMGPQAQAILNPWLGRMKSPACYPFSRSGLHPIGVASYRNAIHLACDRATVERWSPNRLRHNYASLVRRQFGLDAAQVMLGHSTADVTQIYAEVDQNRMSEIASQIG